MESLQHPPTRKPTLACESLQSENSFANDCEEWETIAKATWFGQLQEKNKAQR